MQIFGKPKAKLRQEALDFIDLYKSLGERAENFLPNYVVDKLRMFVRICFEEPDDPAKLNAEINKQILELNEAIPGYVDVSLMIYPHEDSRAFRYNAKKLEFVERLNYLIDTEAVNEQVKQQASNVLRMHDYSVGTPPVNGHNIELRSKILIGDNGNELKKFRDVIGVKGDIEKAQWNYLTDILDQMVAQSSHYTTRPEREFFLNRTASTTNFKGLNGFIKTVVSGTSQTAIELLSKEVFSPDAVKVMEFEGADQLFAKIENDFTSIFVVKVKNMRRNFFNDYRWFPYISRIIIVDDSPESRSSNTSLVFGIHNKVINTLNKVHTKKLGALANSQLNMRLALEKISGQNMELFRKAIEEKIKDYDEELSELKKEQIGRDSDIDKDITLFKFDDFARQIIKDKYVLSKLHDYIVLFQKAKFPEKIKALNQELLNEFEERLNFYFYGNNPKLEIATIVEGGGRNQIRTYGEFLLNKKLKPLAKDVVEKCQSIIDIIPNTYKRTLHNHFHKNFGINLFLEKYREYMTKLENEADNRGRFRNFLMDIGVYEDYKDRSKPEQDVLKQFFSDLANQNLTSIGDDVQMIIRDLIKEQQVRPYILYNQDASWEYKDLFPVDRFDICPFDIAIELDDEDRIAYDRLLSKLQRIKSSLQLFDESGSLWDRFCENTTILINDPSNPTGFTDFNDPELGKLLKFLNDSKITLFLDEAYNDSVKIEDEEEPKWRTLSRYIMNNINFYTNISMVSSLSTTKNLGATGNRLGALVASPAQKELIRYARAKNGIEKANTNSLFHLVNIMETAQMAKKIKDNMEARLPKNASRSRIRQRIESFVKTEVLRNEVVFNKNSKNAKDSKRESLFEGSPLYIFLLNELVSLDKLDILEMPDDFKYKGEAFFSYYRSHLLKELNKYRVNRNFRSESNKRLSIAKSKTREVLADELYSQYATYLDADGSYLFNLKLKNFFSFQDLEKFTYKLAEQRGIAIIPYKSGIMRFSLGDYLEGSEESYQIFAREFESALKVTLNYWDRFFKAKNDPANKDKTSDDLLETLFAAPTDREFVNQVLADFELIKDLKKPKFNTLKISDIKSLYYPFAKDSGVDIHAIEDSKNAVIEFDEKVGTCRNVIEFLQSKAFTKIYENLLPQIYKSVPQIKHMDVNEVIAQYGKTSILKYISNKLNYQPNSNVLDNPDEMNIMAEILLALENTLFSDAKTKILALSPTENVGHDISRLEGANSIIRKYLQEIMIHFNLPFDQKAQRPSVGELFYKGIQRFEEITGKTKEELCISKYVDYLLNRIFESDGFRSITISGELQSKIYNQVWALFNGSQLSLDDKLLSLYLMKEDDALQVALTEKFAALEQALNKRAEDREVYLISKELAFEVIDSDMEKIIAEIRALSMHKVEDELMHRSARHVVLFLTDMIKLAKDTEYYDRYRHTLIVLLKSDFNKQKSSENEMIQHGITIYRGHKMEEKLLEKHNGGTLKWINDIMVRCGVIGAEQPVQIHTRIATDAKKREYPFHMINRTEEEEQKVRGKKEEEVTENQYIKQLYSKPSADFFRKRMEKFVERMDAQDYRCKIVRHGLFKELVVFHKAYMKYLTDNYRLFLYDDVSLEQAKAFVPDVISFFGAPEKVISFPQIGYFDLPGPNGSIKTIVTPLKKKVDYFGNIKKPRLTIMNEKVKEMGGIPKHGSLFAIEENDGTVFVVEVDGDSGVGKSEMLAAMMLKWLKNNLPGIRSIKMIAGDMFHVFADKQGNLYGIGTEVGDFSRVTDFDPEFIEYYNSLFESSADSNVEDLNSRSTISGLCDISMPFKIDIMLTASNYASEEAGVLRFDNPENFILYRDSHGERKEKATSSDNPNFQRSLMRYTADKAVMEVIDAHGNYLDEILDWEKNNNTGVYYLCSSYKMMDKIDVEEVVNKIFVGKPYEKDYIVENVSFDIIKNRFVARASNDESEKSFVITRAYFGELFNSLASTPAGQPFISEHQQNEQKKQLINILKGAPNGKGQGKNIQLGVLSTDLGRKGKEISGPQKAAQELLKMIQEVRIMRPDINERKSRVKQIIDQTYNHLFKNRKYNSEIWRYNYYLYQLHEMKTAEFVRVDDLITAVDLSNIKGFDRKKKNDVFSPLLITPNIQIELSGFTETYEQLLVIPNLQDMSDEFLNDCNDLYVATGYKQDVIVHNMVLQLLLKSGYIDSFDLTVGRITEKVNRETISAAKAAVIRYLDGLKKKEEVEEKPKGPSGGGKEKPKK